MLEEASDGLLYISMLPITHWVLLCLAKELESAKHLSQLSHS